MTSSPLLFSILICLSVVVSCDSSVSGSGTNGADPGVLEAPIAYIKRPIPMDDDNEIQSDLREPLFFAEGGDVYLRSNSTSTATEKNITASVTLGQGDVKDLKPSFDGTKLLFSLRLFDPNPNDDDNPSWNIYEYDLALSSLRRIITDDLKAQGGDDVGPAYLPDGRIIFSSNRQRQSGEILTNEGKARFRALDEDEDTMAMTLHVMNDDGEELHQISFNQSHDLDPTILTHNYSGQVLFTRWDNAGGNNAMHLYKTTPDGTDLQLVYGVDSHRTGVNNSATNNATIQFSQAEEMPDGKIMVIARPFRRTYGAGDIVIIDIENYINNQQPIFSMTGLQGEAQQSATVNKVSTANEISKAGRYSSAFPLWDGSNRILVSKSTCELDVLGIRRPCIEPYISHEMAEEVSPVYSIWLYDRDTHSEKVVLRAQQGLVLTEAVALQSRSLQPDIIADKTVGELDATRRDAGLGVIHIKSVYDFGVDSLGLNDFDGCFLTDCTTATGITEVTDFADPVNALADERPARFVRFIKAVSLPDSDDPDLTDAPDLSGAAFGTSRNQGMREIIGYAPVEPDGSVKVIVPANIPLAISVLDKNGRRIGVRHENWFQVKPGDTMECTGCHTHNTQNNQSPNIHHRVDAAAPSINSGLPASLVWNNTLIPGTTDQYWGDLGETMAQTRFRLASSAIPAAAETQITTDIIYEDYWTDNSARAADVGFSYLYSNLDINLSSPLTTGCLPWTFKCRIVINYPQQIHPMWALPRGAADVNTCTNCHNNVDDAMLVQIPAAQLDLSDGISDINIQRFKSYQELFATDLRQEIDVDGNLNNIQIEVPVLDANGDPAFDVDGFAITQFIDDVTQTLAATMTGNAARSSFFIDKMTSATATRNASAAPTDVGYVDHSTFMSADELRLISEWLDIGAQYFNNPFDPDVPEN